MCSHVELMITRAKKGFGRVSVLDGDEGGCQIAQFGQQRKGLKRVRGARISFHNLPVAAFGGADALQPSLRTQFAYGSLDGAA